MKWIFLPAILICMSSCAPDVRFLDGAWALTGYYQDGQSVSAALDSVSLVFGSEKTYEFRSVGFYRENGTFRTSGNFLFLLDTTAQEKKERALKILFLSDDSLKLEMRHDSVEQVLFFTKKR